jgi:hypothetical protein
MAPLYYHKIDAFVAVMPRGVGLDDDEGNVDRVSLVLHAVGEAVLPVDHEADGRGRAQEQEHAERRKARRSPGQPLHRSLVELSLGEAPCTGRRIRPSNRRFATGAEGADLAGSGSGRNR